MYARGMIFLDTEKKRLYEESAFFKEYFLALQERYYSLKENYQVGKLLEQGAVVNQFQYFLSQNYIPFEKNIYKSNCMCILGVRMNSEGRIADEKIEIVVYTKRVDIHYTLDYGFKKVFSFIHAELPLAKKLVFELHYSIWSDISKEIRAIQEKVEEISQKIYSVSKKNAQIAASSIESICKSQFKDGQAKVYTRDYDAIIKSNDKRIRIFYADFLDDPQAFIKSLAG